MTSPDPESLPERLRERARRMCERALERAGDPDAPVLDPVVREPPAHFPDSYPDSVAAQRERWSGIAGAVVVDHTGDRPRALAVKRGFAPGWQVPGGDHEGEESLAETARRETREETNVEAAVTGVLYARQMHLTYDDREPVALPVVVFTARRVGGRRAVPLNYVPTGEPEIIEAEWFGPDELPAEMRDRERVREHLLALEDAA